MANPLKGEVSRNIAGESYTLVLDAEAICVAEFRLGARGEPRPFRQIWASVSAMGTMTYVRGLLHAALQRHHPKITEAEVSALIRVLKVQGAIDLLTEALNASWGDEDDDEEAAGGASADPPQAGGAGTG